MTENIEPTPASEFALDDWLVGGTEHRLTRSVVVYRDKNLQARIDDVQRRMRLASTVAKDSEGNPEESIGETSTSTLEKEQAALLEQMQRAKAEVTVYALIDDEVEVITESGLKPQSIEWWYAVLAEAGTLEGNKLTAEQWKRVHQTIGVQFATIINAYSTAAQYERVPSAPFSPPASQKVTGL